MQWLPALSSNVALKPGKSLAFYPSLRHIEQLLRSLGKGRCEKVEIRRGKKRRKPGA